MLNKADLASPKWNEKWEKWFQGKGYFVVKINARNGTGMKAIQAEINKACQAKMERDRKRGILNRPVRAMVVGIPNVGKSTFINSFAGKASTKTGNKPGVTKGKQWIRLNKNVELLDTPGILWPKFEDQEIGLKLALIGSIKDDILNKSDLSLSLIQFLLKEYPGTLEKRYGVEEKNISSLNELDLSIEILNQIAKKRLFLLKGNELDLEKTSITVIDEFRSGKLGNITLEFPES